MKQSYEVSRSSVVLFLSTIKAVKAPNAFLLSMATGFLDKILQAFPDADKKLRITIETVEPKKEITNADHE